MAFDKPTRNRLAAFVAEARRLITDEFTQQFQSLYGISDASLTELAQLGHLDDAGLAVAGLLRERIDYLVKTHPADKAGLKAAVARLAREQAFTVLNRLAAVRMAEKRGLIAESVGNGYQSKGFKVFEQVARSGLGEIYQRYRRYLFCLFDELAIDLGVLFDRRSPQGLLFPRENTLLDLLNLLNGPELEPLWQEDETIGWIYQYYNDPAERKKMREESAAPRNSRELAVRNQFFTPRYVVEFLTDNTLGRIWYEMTKGETRLKEQCRYLVRRPTEIFLGPEETAPELPEQEGLSQEELLRQPVYIPHRALKDPRELRMLDPACGSMHFGLYAFDLYEVIYEEAWDQGMESLRADFPDRDALLREIPRLIIEHNIHGIDIDPRAVQIAGLSLWLRAQRSWQQQRLPARERSQIRRSNIVCAEPMPGDKGMLREFITSQFAPEEQPAFTFLLERVFDRMTLAGEAGSLLKIEEEISEAVREAKGLWKKGPQYKPGYLFAEAMPKKPEQLRLDLSGISEEGFWETAEERIYAALQTYAEQAESDGYQRRLFAEDAARGFAFIDLCRKRYDVVVMNPPFGEWSLQYKSLSKIAYPSSYNDIFAAFVDRGGQLLWPGGRIGAITSRTCFFLSSFNKWRDEVVLSQLPPQVLVDLGLGVMDSAMVEAAAYVLGKPELYQVMKNELIVIRLLELEKPACALVTGIEALFEGHPHSNNYTVDPSSFRQIPNAPFAYWVSERIRRLFKELPQFEGDGRTVKQGLATADDFRFIRTAWEIPTESLSEADRRWFPFAKGGSYSPFYADIYLVVNWGYSGSEIRYFGDPTGVRPRSRPQNVNFYFSPGIFQTLRAARLAPHLTPEGCLFGHNGFQAFASKNDILPLLALANSEPLELLFKLLLGRYGFALYIAGTMQLSPVPDLQEHQKNRLEELAHSAWSNRRLADSSTLTSHAFYAPALIRQHGDLKCGIKSCRSLSAQSAEELVFIQSAIDNVAYELYKISDDDRRTIETIFSDHSKIEAKSEEEPDFDEDAFASADTDHALVSELSDYLLGSIFGRWDIRCATGKKPAPKLPDPFAPLPACPPGMLQGDDGLPLSPEEGRRLHSEGHYPLDVTWDGILVDDPAHQLDLECRVRSTLAVLWGDRAEKIELEACKLLGVKSLRDYFRKPSGFFADHLKRYSKSRRQAPIYWPLSTAKGSYTLWIYYHRLSDQTLHTVLADFVDPKIKDVRAEISLLRESNNNRSRLEELLDLESELLDFQAEIERIIKLPWQPNLNDGVLITAAPLWRLFRLPKWQKDLKACLAKLEKGEYDWAHLAYSIWPKRVEEVCKKDRSIAIAHGLEHLCQVEPPKPKAKRVRKKAE